MDDEAEVFMLKLWRLLIFEIELKRHNLTAMFETIADSVTTKQNGIIKENGHIQSSPKAKKTVIFYIIELIDILGVIKFLFL